MTVLLAQPKPVAVKVEVATALPTGGGFQPRLPDKPKVYAAAGPFATVGDVVAECGVEGCGYGCSGPRSIVGLAMKQHHRMFHSNETGVVLLNTPRQ